MKKLIVALLFPISSFAQDYQILVCKDAMTDKEYAYGNNDLLCSRDGKTGFKITIVYSKKGDKISYNGLIVTFSGIGSCSEKDELIILFEDDTKVTYTSWNDFNCEGKSYFDLYSKCFNEFSAKKVKAIRFKNGRTFDSYTYNLTSDESDYFIKARTCFYRGVYPNGNCND